jgi:hypothetical protein
VEPQVWVAASCRQAAVAIDGANDAFNRPSLLRPQSGSATSVMPGNSRELITLAERRFPVRIRVAVP